MTIQDFLWLQENTGFQDSFLADSELVNRRYIFHRVRKCWPSNVNLSMLKATVDKLFHVNTNENHLP